MRQWEYCAITIYSGKVTTFQPPYVAHEVSFSLPVETIEALNGLGEKGWELTGILPSSSSITFFELFLKRAISAGG